MHVDSIIKQKGKDVYATSPDASLLVASSELRDRDVGALLVLDDRQNIVGIISERDIIQTIGARGKQALDLPVSAAMTRNVFTCRSGHSLTDVLKIMAENRLRHLPVVDDDRLQGMISIGDVVGLRIAETDMEIRAMRDYVGAAG